VRTRPCSVFGRPVHLSGLLPLITTRWFSSSLPDPASRRTPCPPKIRRWRLQVSLSVSRLSPSCLTSLCIPFHHLRPVRHYPPPLDISPRAEWDFNPPDASAVRHTLCRSQTSPGRASAATAPHLPATDHPTPNRAYGRSRDLPVPAQGGSVHARVSDHAGSDGRSQ
jgi:hypothetical protein